ncbi:MAG TPA: hypothetical protein VH599_16975 [Ktedonobacterales bacterium]|jgi:Tol biopolymer transport system component
MGAQDTTQLITTSKSNLAKSRLSLWPGLVFGILLALQGCNGLVTDSSQFRPIPGSKDGGASALAINVNTSFQGHIAFVRNQQLYTLSGKDGSVNALVVGSHAQDPAYAPDGSHLAYVRRGANWSDLMVVPSQGGQAIALTHNQGTGKQIVCANGLSEADTAWAANPIWTQDGAALYFLSDAQKLLKTSCGFQDMAVWKIPARGGNAQIVLWPARGDNDTGLPGAGGDANLSLRPGSGVQLTYTHYAYDPKATDNLLVQVFLAALDQQPEPAQGQQSNPTQGQQQETALAPALGIDSKPQQTREASWSPDGQNLAYIIGTDGSASLAIMRVSDPANGSPDFGDYAKSTRPDLGSGAISYPVWSPDGKSLLYLQYKNNQYNLWLAQLAFNGATISIQGKPIQLTDGGVDGDSRPSWTSA